MTVPLRRPASPPAPLKAEFFDRNTLAVARDLIGCQLVVCGNGCEQRYLITETEAYDGPEDLACHASKGRTKRTEILFREPGTIYVYLCYGLHWLVNLVTGPVDYPSAVLIRGVRTLDGARHFDGPAKLTKALGITGELNGRMLGRSSGLWIEPRSAGMKRPRISEGPRIGVAYAGPHWSQVPYRFLIADTGMERRRQASPDSPSAAKSRRSSASA